MRNIEYPTSNYLKRVTFDQRQLKWARCGNGIRMVE